MKVVVVRRKTPRRKAKKHRRVLSTKLTKKKWIQNKKNNIKVVEDYHKITKKIDSENIMISCVTIVATRK